ncbi:MAG TPA: hypothetical protein VGD59_05765 [Acidisarcina sp.]
MKSQGLHVGKRSVQLGMQAAGIRARGKRRFRICTTGSGHGFAVAPSPPDRNFTVAVLNMVGAGGITYIPTC